jgi:hypothetical protein
MALVAVYQALFRDWRPFLSPGETAVIQIVAMDREQSRIITDYIKGILRAAPLLAQFVTGATASSIGPRGPRTGRQNRLQLHRHGTGELRHRRKAGA